MKNILLIGGEGYIGNVISQKLLSKNYKIVSIDNLLYNNQFCVLNKIQSENYRFVYGDMLDTTTIDTLIDASDAVVLLAGLVGDPITKKYPEEYTLINDQGVKAVIDNYAENNE